MLRLWLASRWEMAKFWLWLAFWRWITANVRSAAISVSAVVTDRMPAGAAS